MRKLFVNCGTGYEIIQVNNMLYSVGEYVKAAADGSKALIIADMNTSKLYSEMVKDSLEAAGYTVFSHITSGGEHGKTLSAVEEIYRCLYEHDFHRHDAAIALGGGIVGDIAGFAAATYMRGMKLVQIPTTLIAQTDSAVGGKTGVNLYGMKNMIGCFYQPCLVYIDTAVLETLPPREYRAGMAEIIKYACIYDKELYDSLMQDTCDMDAVIIRCCDIKRQVVERDECDLGLRHILNFGHTAAHAIEAASDNTILHGEAVALGMCAIAHAGEALGVTESGTEKKIIAVCEKYGLEYRIPNNLDYKRYIDADKKIEGYAIREVFLKKIGECSVVSLDLNTLRELLP